MRVNVGDFVLLKYLDFTNEVQTGIFFIIYHECYDIPGSSSFVAVKVSSKSSGYQVPVYKEYLHFLDRNSFINCSSPHRFQEKQVIKILGRANNYYVNRVLTQVESYSKQVSKQLLDRLGGQRFEPSNRS